MNTRDAPYDHIVIGGGTAGVVIAARLSEDPHRRVLLLEAGPDYPHEPPAALLDLSAAVLEGHNWDLQAILSEEETAPLSAEQTRVSRVFQVAASRLGPGSRRPALAVAEPASARVLYPLGKVVGGGSAINGGLAFFPRPEDCAGWAAAGNDRWSWTQLQPFVDRVARAEPDKPALAMETMPAAALTGGHAAFYDACLAMGRPAIDLVDGTITGVGVLPKSSRNGRRVSMSSLYLTAARRRANLTIQPDCLVDRVIVERRNGALMATGVEAIVDGRLYRVAGTQIVLAAGAIGSPAILQRSGIGASPELTRAGVTTLLDRPGVGQNLQDHPAVSIWAVPTAGSCRAGEDVHQVLLQQRSAIAADARCDLQFFMLSGIWTPGFPALRDVVGSDLAIGISVVVATPRSRGHVAIVDRDPRRSPRITLNCVRETADLQRMMEGLRIAWRLVRDERLARHIDRVVLWSAGTIDSDPLLARMIRSTVRTVWHPVGTLRMGREGDALAVVDQHGRLHGCDNITVADASILPSIPSVPPSLTCTLIGERIAADLRSSGAPTT